MGNCLRTLGLLLLLSGLSACGGSEKPVDASVSQPGLKDKEALAIPVQVEPPARSNISANFDTNARIVAERRVDVTSEGIGKCVAVLTDEGQTVTPGQVLAELDKQEAIAALNQAEVQVRQQRAVYDRALKTWKAGLGPKIDYENAKFAYEQSQANYDLQKVQLDNLTIQAPIAGIVTRKNIQVGSLVTTGAPVFSVVDPTSYMVEINPPERELHRLNVGQVATVTVDALPGKELKATVRRVNPAVENGTVKATLDFAAEERALLKEGAFARVGLVMDTHENALLVPKDALLEENGRKYLFVVEPGTGTTPAAPVSTPEAKGAATTLVAQRLEVQTGFENASSIEITSGLEDGARVVVMGQHTLKPGAEVVVTDPAQQLAESVKKNPEEALAAAKAARTKGEAPAVGQGRHH